MRIDEILCRVRSEFLEMPGLRLTLPQAQRLWGLDHQMCTRVLDALVEERFLLRLANGTYMRPSGPMRTSPPSGDRRALR